MDLNRPHSIAPFTWLRKGILDFRNSRVTSVAIHRAIFTRRYHHTETLKTRYFLRLTWSCKDEKHSHGERITTCYLLSVKWFWRLSSSFYNVTIVPYKVISVSFHSGNYSVISLSHWAKYLFFIKAGLFVAQDASVSHRVYLQALRAGAHWDKCGKEWLRADSKLKGRKLQVLTEDNKTDKSQ